MSNSLDPDQARRFVGPDLGPNCLPMLSADDTGKQRVKLVLNRLIPKLHVSFWVSEPRHEKTNILHMRKQRRRSASR